MSYRDKLTTRAEEVTVGGFEQDVLSNLNIW